MFDTSLIALAGILKRYSFYFVLLVRLISLMVFLWSRYYMSRRFKLAVFFWSLLAFVLSIVVLLMRRDILSTFLGWEGLGLSRFLLIVFYQNWISSNGGILTLITNRLGDAILIITACYWILFKPFVLTIRRRICLLILLLVVTTTKRAQWPFVNWLPAAMAAPTPVRSLVQFHSSYSRNLIINSFNTK